MQTPEWLLKELIRKLDIIFLKKNISDMIINYFKTLPIVSIIK